MKKTKITLLILFGLLLLFTIYSLYPIITYNPDIKNSPGRIFISDRFGKVITDKQKPNGYYKYINNDMNSEFVKALLKVEDSDYYYHNGVALKSKFRAILSNIKLGKIVSGGSTITEQYIKNKYFLGYKRTYLQKARESFLALYISLFLGKGDSPKREILSNKDIILEKYLNNVYFGNNIYGLGGAIEVYFDKTDINELTHEEITLLISLLNNPGIKSLEESHFRDYFDKIKTRLGYSFERTIFRLNKKENIDKYPFVTSRVLEQEGNLSSQKEIILESSIDSELQEFARNMLNETLDNLKGKNVTNGAFVVYNPKTMEVLSYQGSRDFDSSKTDGQVDVITSKRQLGSTLKPFLYLKALKNGVNPDDFIVDIEREYNSFKEGKTYISENYSLREYGLVRFKKALGNSLNNASVRLAKELGLGVVWQFFKDYGLDLNYNPEHYGYSLVLGNPSLSLENLVLSYRNLLPEYDVDNSKILNFLTSSSIPIIKENEIDTNKFLLYNILQDPDNRDISFGVNSILNTSIYQAVKTGTSSDFRDNVIVSYNPDLIVGIWIGNNDNSSMTGVSGITGAGYLWHQIIEKAIELGIITDSNYKKPNGVEKGNYCLDENCFRKEIIYKKTGKDYKSSILNNKYHKEDIYENLSNFEEKKLEDMNFNIIK